MIKRLIKRGFSAKVFAWGGNHLNLGYEIQNSNDANFPKELNIEENLCLQKLVSGYSESALLSGEGKIYTFGTNYMVASNKRIPSALNIAQQDKSFVDVDIDKSHIIALDKEGVVHLWSKYAGLTEVSLPGKATMVTAGNNVSLAVVKGEDNVEKVFMWGSRNFSTNSIFCGAISELDTPREMTPVNKILAKLGSPIKKVKIVNSSAVVLLEGGQMISWGNNVKGNIGVPRCELSLVDDYVYQPAQPLKMCGINEKIIDFDLSDNILIILSENGNAYYSGIDGVLSLKKIDFFPELKVAKVGCKFNQYYLQACNGKTFSNQPFKGQENIKYFGSYELYELEGHFFGSRVVENISGKYENAFALCK